MIEIDLGDRPKEGIGRRECEGCGIMFTPRKPNHVYCSDCICLMYSNDDENDNGVPEVTFE